MNRIDGPSTHILTPSGPERGQVSLPIDAMRGEKAVPVANINEGFSLNDAAEELSLHMAEKTEDKHAAERKVKGERPMPLLHANEIVEFLSHTHDPDAQEKLIELTQQLLERQALPRQTAERAFKDVTQQFLALQYALHEGEQQGAPAAVLDDIRDALAELELESGPQIRAGLNSLRTAGGFANNADGVMDFQRTYRDVVLGQNTLGKTLDMALERFGGTDFGRGLEHLIMALGHDLAAAHPSIDANRLQALLSDLYHLGVVITVLENCNELRATLASQFGTALDSTQLMRDLVGLSAEKWISESRFVSLSEQYEISALHGRILFLAGVRGMLKDLPVQIYTDPDARQAVLNANQAALDAVIAEEDAS